MSQESRAVSPVISVILLVAVVVILAATVSVFALSLGEDTSEVGPSVTFSVTQENEQVVLVHAAGEAVEASSLEMTGVKRWGVSADTLVAGERITANPTPDAERIDIVWNGKESSATLRTVDVSNLDVRSLVVNDQFERGTDSDAESWEQDEEASGPVERTNEQSLSGEYSMKQVDITTGYGARTFVSDPITVSGGTEYELGGSYYLAGTTNSSSEYRYAVRIRWFEEDGSEVRTDPFFADFSTFDTWTEIRKSATAPSNAVTARLVVQAKRDRGATDLTNVYWDEMFIEES